MMPHYRVGLDIGGTKIATHIVNQYDEIVFQTSFPTVRGTGFINHIFEVIDEMINLIKNRSIGQLRGIGVGVPGMVDQMKGEVSLATNLRLDGPLPLQMLISDRFGVPTMIENDVRLAAVGVQTCFDLDNFVYLSVGTGLSAGFVLNGELLRGGRGMAGEVGHIVELDREGQPVMLEELIAGPAMMRQMRAAGLDYQYPSHLFDQAAKGNPKALAVAKPILYQLARVIQWATLMNDVDRIVLGGGVVQTSPSLSALLLRELEFMRSHSPVAEQLLLNGKILFLPDQFNPGLWGATHLAAQAIHLVES